MTRKPPARAAGPRWWLAWGHFPPPYRKVLRTGPPWEAAEAVLTRDTRAVITGQQGPGRPPGPLGLRAINLLFPGNEPCLVTGPEDPQRCLETQAASPLRGLPTPEGVRGPTHGQGQACCWNSRPGTSGPWPSSKRPPSSCFSDVNPQKEPRGASCTCGPSTKERRGRNLPGGWQGLWGLLLKRRGTTWGKVCP